MTDSEIFSRLTDIFHDVFDNDDIELTPDMTAEDVEEWDSLSHIRLIVAAEREFGVSFSSSEVANLENVGQFVDLIVARTAD
ncbi:MAG: acyl carrier protein [Rhodospirillaceae bacterium]|nr:acyl carrier protein [Marinovum sp.]RZO37403.1 MAG: acyl carrier protein [Rhodospirillaceae bacterium]|tara:strand:+ start:296 stop:541 length:246 start_codon:yes stop_codon:yes gene_type:complete